MNTQEVNSLYIGCICQDQERFMVIKVYRRKDKQTESVDCLYAAGQIFNKAAHRLHSHCNIIHRATAQANLVGVFGHYISEYASMFMCSDLRRRLSQLNKGRKENKMGRNITISIVEHENGFVVNNNNGAQSLVAMSDKGVTELVSKVVKESFSKKAVKKQEELIEKSNYDWS